MLQQSVSSQTNIAVSAQALTAELVSAAINGRVVTPWRPWGGLGMPELRLAARPGSHCCLLMS